MECVRCHKEFDENTPKNSVLSNGYAAYYACPHCGKLYRFKMEITSLVVPDKYILRNTDDWNKPIVKDSEFKEKE